MSADNWGKCPKCKQLKEAEQVKAKADADASYGRIPAAEWTKLNRKANEPVKFDDTLREDYETGIYNGVFSVDYHGSCDRCGFKFSFKHEEQVKVE